MKKTNSLLLIIVSILFFSCSENSSNTDETQIPENLYSLKINEFVALGSLQINEFGDARDWFEIYNSSEKEIKLEAYKYFFSDSRGNPTKYTLPVDTTIPAKGFIMIWCDGESVFQEQIHTNFKLSGLGERIVFSYWSNGKILTVDSTSYGAVLDAVSYGRFPDGESDFIELSEPTPGIANIK